MHSWLPAWETATGQIIRATKPPNNATPVCWQTSRSQILDVGTLDKHKLDGHLIKGLAARGVVAVITTIYRLDIYSIDASIQVCMGSDPTGQQFACLFDTGAEISIINSNGPQFERMTKWMKNDLLHPLNDDQAIQGITGSTTLANLYAIPLTFVNSTLPSQSITIPARAAHLTQAVDIVIGLDLIILHEITLNPAKSKATIAKYAVPFQERFTDRTPIEITSVPLDGCYGQQLQTILPLAYPIPTDLPDMKMISCTH